MSRGAYAKVAARNGALLERVRELKADHPFWGYRRVWAYLRYIDGLTVNQKRVYGVMKANDLLVKPNLKLRARRKADTRKPRPSRPNEWWGIDMTKVMIEGFGWIYLVVVLDWHSKKVVGHYAGLQARAWHWLVALNRAVNRQFPGGIQGQSLNLMADNGCQPTSLAFMRACAALSIRQVFTSYSNPKGNADTERFLRTLKEELVWLREWTSPSAFFAALDRWLAEYNASYLHSALGYRAPNVVEAGQLHPVATAAEPLTVAPEPLANHGRVHDFAGQDEAGSVGEHNQSDRTGGQRRHASMTIFPRPIGITMMRVILDRADAVLRSGSYLVHKAGEHEGAISNSTFLRAIRASTFGRYHAISLVLPNCGSARNGLNSL